jgi:hypothetical protein
MYLWAMGMQGPMPKDLPLPFKPGGACFRLIGTHFLVLKIYWEGICVSRKIARAQVILRTYFILLVSQFSSEEKGEVGTKYKVNLLLTSGLRRTNLEPKGRLPKALDWICLSSFENGGR